MLAVVAPSVVMLAVVEEADEAVVVLELLLEVEVPSDVLVGGGPGGGPGGPGGGPDTVELELSAVELELSALDVPWRSATSDSSWLDRSLVVPAVVVLSVVVPVADDEVDVLLAVLVPLDCRLVSSDWTSEMSFDVAEP